MHHLRVTCVICGADTPRNLCGICSRNVALDFPLLLKYPRVLSEDKVPDEVMRKFGKKYEGRKLYVDYGDVLVVNEILRAWNRGEMFEDPGCLATVVCIYMQDQYADYLRNFDLSDDYYLELAERVARDILASNDRCAEAHHNLAVIYLRRKDHDRALHHLGKLNELLPEDVHYMMMRGDVLREMGRWGAAIQAYNEVLKREPERAEAWKKIAMILMDKEKYEEAEKVFLKALEIDNKDWESWYLRGVCLRKMGRWGGALQAFENAIALNPRHRESYVNAIGIAEERGLNEKADKLRKKFQQATGGAL